MKKITWGHGVVLALLSFITFILFMIFIFPNGKENSELITENYYEEELVFQDVIDAKNAADALEQKPIYKQEKHQIVIVFPEEYNNENTNFAIDLQRFNDQNLDVKKEMKLNTQNQIVIPEKVLIKGNYILKMKWIKDHKNYQIDYHLVW